MTIQHLIGLAINVSMFAIVLALGLEATTRQTTALFRNPALLVRSLLSMHAAMVVVVILIGVVFDPAPEIKIALVGLALSPVPPLLPGKQLKAGGSADYTIGLLVAASICSLVVVPVGLMVLNAMFGLDMHVSPLNIAGMVLVSIVLPLFAGIIIRGYAPAFAKRVARPLTLAAFALLGVAVIPVLFVSWPAVTTLFGDGLVVGLLAFTLIGLAVGHWLGGPDPADRTVLALVTSSRHPGVAIAIASLNFPDAQLAIVVVLYHLLLGTVIATPYVKWRTREHAARQQGVS